MNQIVAMSGWSLLALLTLFLGFFSAYEGGVTSVGAAVALWLISGAVVVRLVVPTFASLITRQEEGML